MRIFTCIGDLHMHIIYFRTYNNDKNNRGDIMKSYIYSLLIMSFIAGIINSYAENLKKTQKYINYFMSIIMIILMISPLTSIISNTEKIKENLNFIIEEITDNESIQGTNEIIINSGKEAIIKGIKNILIENYGFNEKEIQIKLEADSSNIEAIKISKITVILTGKASWSDVDKVKEYLSKNIGATIEVTRR